MQAHCEMEKVMGAPVQRWAPAPHWVLLGSSQDPATQRSSPLAFYSVAFNPICCHRDGMKVLEVCSVPHSYTALTTSVEYLSSCTAEHKKAGTDLSRDGCLHHAWHQPARLRSLHHSTHSCSAHIPRSDPRAHPSAVFHEWYPLSACHPASLALMCTAAELPGVGWCEHGGFKVLMLRT